MSYYCMDPGKSFDLFFFFFLNLPQWFHFNREGGMLRRRAMEVKVCMCVFMCISVWQRKVKSGRGERVSSPIRSFTQPSRGASRVPHCSPKASTRRHCCCAASALNPPPTPPHRKQGYCPRDVTSETPTLPLACSRSLPHAPSLLPWQPRKE